MDLNDARCPSQLSMASETASSVGTDSYDENDSIANGCASDADPQRIKQEFRALGVIYL